MKTKLKYLTINSLKKKLSSKWFKVINIILLICIPLLCNIDSIIKFFGGDFLEPTKVHVVDNTNKVYKSFESTFKANNKIVLEQSEIKISKSKKNYKELYKKIKKDKSKDIIIEINTDKENLFKAKIVSYKTIDTFVYQNMVNSLNSTKANIALSLSNIDKAELASINKTINVDRVYISEDVDENADFLKMISSILIPIFIVPFFFLITMVVSMIGAEINEEKTSRSMEIIISSVSAKVHFISKMISVNLFVLIQSLLLGVYSVIGTISRTLISGNGLINSFDANTSGMIDTFLKSDMFIEVIKAIPFTIILFILSFIAYTLVAGILASITTSIEDYSQIQTPLMSIIMIGYFLAIIASAYESSVFIKAASFIPFISAIVSPVLLMLGQIGFLEIIISILLMVLTNYLLLKFGIRVYKVGILNYSSNKLWGKIFKAIKTKE